MPTTKPYTSLTLSIAGSRITADRFMRAVESFFGLIDEVSQAMTGAPKTIEWIVSVKRGSIVLGAAGEAKSPAVSVAAVVNAAYTGLKQLQEYGKRPARPAHFTENALQDARDLARLVDGKAVKVVQVRRSNDRFRVHERAVLNIDSILGGTLVEVGVVEGRLQMISSRGTLHVGVWDSAGDRLVRCFVKPDMIDEAKAALDKRVALAGIIRYRPNGEPVSIEVESLEVFPEESELPTADEVYGILSSAR
jgi:hypothetical protein